MTFMNEVLTGLKAHPKALSPKYLYDERGSELFLDICELEEYYPTRAEKEILQTYGREIAQLIGPNAAIIEPGSGSGEKVRYLLTALKRPRAYVPIEISREILMLMTEELYREYPGLKVLPLNADFLAVEKLPSLAGEMIEKRVVFFPGSTIGNFNPNEAIEFLKKYSTLVGANAAFVIGVDMKKDPMMLVRAYDDERGVTAAFNLNLLERMNREARASFRPERFAHRAIYNKEKGRVEMHLVSLIPQLVQVGDEAIFFSEGESIHTENSYKYSPEEFIELGRSAGLSIRKHWQDSEHRFCLYYFERENS